MVTTTWLFSIRVCVGRAGIGENGEGGRVMRVMRVLCGGEEVPRLRDGKG